MIRRMRDRTVACMNGIIITPRPVPPARTSPGGTVAGLLFVTFSAITSRLFLLGLWIFGSLLGDAFGSAALPILGAIFLPWTTFAYAIMWGAASDRLYGWEWLVVGIGLILDLITWRITVRLLRR
jgi:hypothetical protein